MSKRKGPAREPADAVALTRVRWTQAGEHKGAWSEHGTHTAGEIVDTAHAGALIELGFAEAAN